ncbi:helix-turn-helix domain-containing protein [Streptomyces sp. NPDC127066]|uniref:helix-turn-helix domain-containing protein n=1 Tax=Streptomyces sp. NPDC127066 TaxID=3347125 RepID=UPI003649BBD9
MNRKEPGRPTTQVDPSKGALEQLAVDLLRLREYKELTLEQLAALSGLSRATLSAATQGTKCPSWDTMKSYLKATGQDPSAWRPRWEMIADPKQREAAGLPDAPEQRAAVKRMLPSEVMTVHGFAVALRQLKVWQRNPTYQKIANVSARHNLAVRQTTICNVFRGTKLPTENALIGVLVGMGLSQRDEEFSDWLEKRRELEAARVERALELAPVDGDISRKSGFTPLHKKRAPIPRQRSYGIRNRLIQRRRQQIIS